MEKRAALILEGFGGTICCESQVKSSANKWIQAGPQEEKTTGGTGHCSERAHKTLDSSELFSFLRTAFFKGLFLFACYTSAQAESFLSSFNPFFYFAGGKKTPPQNQVPRSALVAKSERAAASFFSLSPSPESELWIALQNWLLWMDQGGEKNV